MLKKICHPPPPPVRFNAPTPPVIHLPLNDQQRIIHDQLTTAAKSDHILPDQNTLQPSPSTSQFSPPASMSQYLQDEFVQDEDYQLPNLPAQNLQSSQTPFTRSKARLQKKIAPIFSLPLSERLQHAKTSGKNRFFLSFQKQRSLVETCNNVAAQIMAIQQKKIPPPPLTPLKKLSAQMFIHEITMVCHTLPFMVRKILPL
jgi:hypothetical protein